MKGISFSMGMLLTVALLALGAPRAQAQQVYVDAVDYPTPGAGWEAFYDLERRLAEDFDQSCGDTFCEGEYSDYQPLRYRCSVRQRDGVLGQCVWTFGASESSIDPATGQVLVDAKLWQCPTPLLPQTRLVALYKALAGEHPLFAPLPHSQRSVNDGLIDCL
ncbi:hypothetical protein QSH18_08935 [Xanthomonas sp. NCPPB 2654]|uniref:hypothetical protein n=1 Tax=unclassified Xanthomonas TaxID=2643310 RepID=UPI0021DFF089|nr:MULTISPECIES: hypothetical protein [unclassified Xanthomonas]MDL5365728.1 hypothetical protein [Xanthomonas sp. NCPPB 2654]UYC19884.1 hypothetical protein NUG20_17185 [Xanthomonas sp. CFBP 8443]